MSSSLKTANKWDASTGHCSLKAREALPAKNMKIAGEPRSATPKKQSVAKCEKDAAYPFTVLKISTIIITEQNIFFIHDTPVCLPVGSSPDFI
jgi:hypothetical protein